LSQVNVNDPGGYRGDEGSRWLLPLILGLLALAVIAWLLFANPFGGYTGANTAGSGAGVSTVAPATGGTTGTVTGGTSGMGAGTTTGGTGTSGTSGTGAGTTTGGTSGGGATTKP
jgi:hypothetical protein